MFGVLASHNIKIQLPELLPSPAAEAQVLQAVPIRYSLLVFGFRARHKKAAGSLVAVAARSSSWCGRCSGSSHSL